ncbi:hypothetical protein M1M85_02075, partial [Nitrospinaceae bacterium]|nr:hypothetical protein [Nitrospinaceae bacterium]
MLNKTRKLITGAVLNLSAAVLLLLFSVAQVEGAATEVATGDTVSATDADGLKETGETGAVAVWLTTGAALTMGADAVASLTLSEASAATVLTFSHILSAGTHTSIMAGDVVVSGHADNVINITGVTTATHLNFTGNVTETLGTINITTAATCTTHTFTFDNATAEDHIIDAAIIEGASGTTSVVNVTNTEGTTTNDVTFADTITMDNIAIAANAGATFTGAVTGITTTTSTRTQTFSFAGAAHTGAMNFAADGEIAMGTGSLIVGAVTTDADAQGTLTLAAPTADADVVTGAIGAAGGNRLKVLNIAVLSHDTTLTSTVDADLINISQASGVAGTVVFEGHVDFDTGSMVLNSGALATADILVQIASAKNLEGGGNVATGLTDTGVIEFMTGTQAVTGTIGTAGTVLKEIKRSGSGVLTLSGHAFATQLRVDNSNAAAVTMGGTKLLTANVYFDADGGVKMGTGITGDITTETDNTGTITTEEDATITGSIGAPSLDIKLLDVDDDLGVTGTIYSNSVDIAASKTLTMSANADILAPITFSGDGTLVLATGSDITGAIAGGGNDSGTITVAGVSTITGQIGPAGCATDIKAINLSTSSSKLTLVGGMEVATTTLADGSELIFAEADNTTAVSGIITTNGDTGSVNIGTVSVTVDATPVISATGTLAVTIGTTNGQLIYSGGATFATGTILKPTIAGRITSGTEIKVYDGGSGTPNIPGTIQESYDRYTFTLAVCSTNDLCLTPTLVTPSGVSGAGAAVNAVADVAFAADTTMNDALQGLSGAVLQKALVSLAPSVDGGAVVGAVSAGAASGATVSTQMASLRSGIAAGQGLNAGDGTGGEERFWTQGFGAYGDQDIREKIAGFTSTTGGVAFGVDDRYSDDLILGLAYSYSLTNVDSSESQNETQVQSHQATFY